MLHSPDIAGTWELPSTIALGQKEYMHIGEDGRIVQFVHKDSSGKKFIPMLLWTNYQQGNLYIVRQNPSQDSRSWAVGFTVHNSKLILEREEGYAFATPATEIPDWFQARLKEAHAKMDKMENNT